MSDIAKEIDQEYKMKQIYMCRKCVYWNKSKKSCMEENCVKEKIKKAKKSIDISCTRCYNIVKLREIRLHREGSTQKKEKKL